MSGARCCCLQNSLKNSNTEKSKALAFINTKDLEISFYQQKFNRLII